MKRLMILIFILTISLIFFFYPHLLKLVKCGKPKSQDYSCHDYAVIESNFPYHLQKESFCNFYKLSDEEKSFFEQYQTNAFLVIQNGKIIFEEYFNNLDSNSLGNSFSAAKAITSILTGIAIDKGYIKSTEQKVSDFFPHLTSPLDTMLTIEHLLTMSSGIKWSEKFNNPLSDVVKAYYTNRLKKQISSFHVTDTPGKIMNYQCINSLILGQIIEKASGKPLDKFAQENLWDKIGASNHAYWTKTKDGIIKSFCCFYATARDYAKLGLLLLNKGRAEDGTYIVSSQFIQRMTKPNTFLLDKKGQKVTYYGYQLWITKHQGYTIPYFRGMYGQYIFIIPQKDAVVVRLGNKSTKGQERPTPEDARTYLKVAFKILR